MAQFFKVAKMSKLPVHDGSLEEVEGKGTLVEVEGHRIALFNLDGEVFAIDDTCTHEGGPLSEGNVQGDQVICPWHGSRFDLCTGEVQGGPAVYPQPRYETRVRSGKVEIRIAKVDDKG